jgi:lipopolysaccharide export system protein LptA
MTLYGVTGVARLLVVAFMLDGTFVLAAAAQSASPIIPGGAARGPVSINAPSLDYLDREHRLVYSGGVVARQGDATMKASSLTILLNAGATPPPADASGGVVNAAGGNQIHRIEAAGPVSIVSKNQVGTGDSGVYDRPSNKLTLNGNVTLSQCGNVLKGAKLTYDLTSGRAQVSGGVTSLFTPGANCDDAGKPKVAPEKPQKPATGEPRARR